MILNWIKIALLQYKKNWLSTIINFLGITIGLCSLLLVLLHWQDEVSYENWNPKKSEIYALEQYFKKDNVYGASISVSMVNRAKEKISEIEEFLLIEFTRKEYKIEVDGKSINQEVLLSSPAFFDFFPFKILAGDGKTALQNTNSIALSKEASLELFGTTQSAGKTLTIANNSYLVTAVYELPKENTVVKPKLLLLSTKYAGDFKNPNMNWGNFNYFCFFKIKKGSSLDVIRKKMFREVYLYRANLNKGISSEDFLELYGPNDSKFTPLHKMRLHLESSFFELGNYQLLIILFSLSVLLLLMSVINFINLKTAQSSQRAKEVGIRKALGSSKLQLLLQFLLETFLLCFVAYLFSLALAELVLPFFNKFLNKSMHINSDFYGYSFVLISIISLLSGVIPAVYLSNYKAIYTLKGSFARSRSGVWLRNGILGFQLAVSSFFIVGTLVISQQVTYLMNKDLGFKSNRLYTIYFLQETRHSWLKYERLKTELLKIKGVEQVSYSEALPGGNSFSTSNIDWRNKSIFGQHHSMDFNYLELIQSRLLKGRFLSEKFSSDTISNLLVNESFVKKMGWQLNEALEQKVMPGFDTIEYNIVGVVEDFNINNPANEVYPMVLFHYKASDWKRYAIQNVVLKLNANDLQATVARVKEFWQKKVEPGYNYYGNFIDKNFERYFIKYEKQQGLFVTLNALVLLVALLGLFALSSLMIEQKLKDIAIKKVLGASSRKLIKDLVKQFLWISLLSSLISFPISYYFLREWLNDFAYRIDMPWLAYVISLLLMLLLTLIVTSVKAYRATKVNLVKYLKYE